MIGKTLSHYHIVEQIGAGGMGEVYRARDEHLGRDVAIKVLPPGMLTDEAARKRFPKEARALSKLNHPNIQTVLDFDTQDGVDFLVTEYVPGVTLSDKLALRALPEKDVTQLGAQLAEGLAAAHEHGVVHRDLKPANLRVTPDGWLKILDFGLAKLVRPMGDRATIEGTTESVSETQAGAGTLPYMAPEQLRGENVDARTDIYAAGAVLYEMATGQRPFPETQTTQLIDAVLHRPPVAPRALNPRVSLELEQIILKCLEKEPENRYQSAREVVVDLRRSGAPVSTATGRRAAPRRTLWHILLPAVGIAAVVLLLALLGLDLERLRDRLLGGPAPGPITSLAVLPLENLMGDPEQEYFVDGMTEALISELAQIGALKVISRTSVMRFKGTDKSLPEIARDLGVDGIIEGSVLRAGDQVRITAQLIEGATDRHLWASNYERDLSNILALQSEVARAIAREIKIKLTAREQARLASPRPVNTEVYQLYLRGRYHWNQRTQEGFKKGLEFFEQALERDPTYPLAYAGLADTYSLLANYFLLPPQEAFPRAKAAATKALEIDDTLAEAHASLAFARHHYDWDWSGAEGEYKRALELNPGYATAHQWYAEYLTTVGRHEEAIAEIRRAQELDPLSLVIDSNVGRLLYYAHRYDQAIDELQNTLMLDPNFPWAHVFLGMAFEQKGMYAEAMAEAQKVVALGGGGPNVVLARAYAASGRTDDARKMLKALQQRYGEDVESYSMGGIHAALGEKDEAFAWLEKAYEENSFFLVFLKTDPWFEPLHNDARFADLLARLSFPE